MLYWYYPVVTFIFYTLLPFKIARYPKSYTESQRGKKSWNSDINAMYKIYFIVILKHRIKPFYTGVNLCYSTELELSFICHHSKMLNFYPTYLNEKINKYQWVNSRNVFQLALYSRLPTVHIITALTMYWGINYCVGLFIVCSLLSLYIASYVYGKISDK